MRRQQTTSPATIAAGARIAAGDSLDELVTAWLASVSPGTRRSYRSTITRLRAELRLVELDLDSDPSVVSQIVGTWAACGMDSESGRQPRRSTVQQRLSRVSAFFGWASRHAWGQMVVSGEAGDEDATIQGGDGAGDNGSRR